MGRYKPVLPRAPAIGSILPRVIAATRVNGGMVTSIDPVDLEDNASQSIKNMRVRFDKVLRRSGYELLKDKHPGGTLITKPNSNKVLKIVSAKDLIGNATTFRFSKTGVHKLSAGSWSALTGTALTGGDSDRITFIVLGDDFFFANNGADEIQKITGAASWADNGNAPKYKYLTGFYERLVGAHKQGSSGVEVGWSGQRAPTEWSAANNISAGFEELIESPVDVSDHIRGVFGVTNYLIVPKERSIWIATKNPQPQKPFNFYNSAPGIGTDLPYSCVVWEQGLIFADTKTGTVWFYAVTSQPEPIGRPNDALFIRQLTQASPDEIFASYNSIENEYTIVIPYSTGNVYPAWTYNFRNKAWSYDEYPNTVWSLQDFDYSSGYISIDELLGTIDGLGSVQIDNLSPPAKLDPTRAFGLTNGDIIVEAKYDPSIDTDNAVAFSSWWVSKSFQMNGDDQSIGHVRFDIQYDDLTDIEFFYAIDGNLFDDELSVPLPPFLTLT